MSDTISRQAAIDAINKAFERVFAWDGTGLLGDKVLENVPSAQPEIIYCKDCKHWTNNIGDSELRDNYCNEVAHGFYYRCNGDDFCSRAERRDNG